MLLLEVFTKAIIDRKKRVQKMQSEPPKNEVRERIRNKALTKVEKEISILESESEKVRLYMEGLHFH
jgi:hypothetical protein